MDFDDKEQYEETLRDERTDWLDVAHDTEALMYDTAIDLSTVANQLAYLSPESPAVWTLRRCSALLKTQAKRLSSATGQKLSEDLRQAQESSGNMLRACLAGVFTALPKDKIGPEEQAGLQSLIEQAERTGSPTVQE
jgi:hypothetical protein